MITCDSKREVGSLALPLVLTSALLLLAFGFGGWAFAQMLDYKNNSDAKVAQAVTTAKQQEDTAKDAAFAEAEKQPLRTYNGPEAYGSLAVSYPKTWSGYVSDKRNGSPYVDGYFYPGVVPDTTADSSVFALRVQVVANSYANELSQFTNSTKQGSVQVSPYKLPKVPGVIGARIDGKISTDKTGTLILLPLRNMTLKIWTEAPQFQGDFNTYVLPNFTFAP